MVANTYTGADNSLSIQICEFGISCVKGSCSFTLLLLFWIGQSCELDGMVVTPLVKVLRSFLGRANFKITFYDLTGIRQEETFLVSS